MSHQGYEGWFPECLICGMGNVGGVVCLSPMCHEESQGQVISDATERLIEKDSQFWKLCNLCDHASLASSASWGSYAICIDCWNQYAVKNELPPSAPNQLKS